MAQPTIQQLFDLIGRFALVTGGARNLGRDAACALAEADADVAITSRSLEAARKTAIEIAAETGRKIVGFACDMRYEDQVSALVDAVLAELSRIDVLVNNTGSGVSTVEHKPLEQRPIEEWSFTIGVT